MAQATEFVCTMCWEVFTIDDTVCPAPTCRRSRPNTGWNRMPFDFRSKYRFWQQLGKGGMGAVFLATGIETASEGTQKYLAVKVVQQAKDANIRQAVVEQFRVEGKTSMYLDELYEGFVKVLDFKQDDPPYLAMEFVKWPTMAAFRKRHAELRPLFVAHMGKAALESLSGMHNSNLVHFDLKPANLFATQAPGDTQECLVKIGDLGICRKPATTIATVSTSKPKPFDARIVGSVSYMSPEQMEGSPVGLESDIHSIGSIIWELLTGVVPFEGVGRTSQERLCSRFVKVREPLGQPVDMPDELYAALSKALAFQPTDRCDCREFIDALKDFIEKKELEERALREALKDELVELEELLRERLSGLAELLPLTELLVALQEQKVSLSRRIEDLGEDIEELRKEAKSFAERIDQIESNLQQAGKKIEKDSERYSRTKATAYSGMPAMTEENLSSIPPSLLAEVAVPKADEDQSDKKPKRKKSYLYAVVGIVLLILLFAAAALFAATAARLLTGI